MTIETLTFEINRTSVSNFGYNITNESLTSGQGGFPTEQDAIKAGISKLSKQLNVTVQI